MRFDEGLDVGEDNVGRDMNKIVIQFEIEIIVLIGTYYTKFDVYFIFFVLYLKNLI